MEKSPNRIRSVISFITIYASRNSSAGYCIASFPLQQYENKYSFLQKIFLIGLQPKMKNPKFLFLKETPGAVKSRG